jgi:replicative DNA helicase
MSQNQLPTNTMTQDINISIERKLLGIVLSDITDIGPILRSVDRDCFTEGRAEIYDACKLNHDASRPVNIVTVGKTLIERKRGELAVEMTHCTDGVYNAHNWKAYVGDLHEAKMQRGLEDIKRDLMKDFDIERAFNRLKALQAQNTEAAVFVAHDMLVDFMKELDAQVSGRTSLEVTPTGLRPLDKIITGFAAGELIYLGGRPAMGKTLVAMQIAMNQAQANHIVMFFTIEMSGQQLMARMTSNLSETNGAAFLDPYNRISKQQVTEISVAVDQMREAPLLIVDLPEATLSRIEAEIMRVKSKFDVRGVYIDYMQLVQALPEDKSKPKTEQVTNLSKAFKAMTRRTKVFTVVVCSLSRNTEQRGDKRPMLSDLRESGQLEFDADKVIFVHREAEYMSGTGRQDKAHQMEIIVRKNRNGQQGTAHVKAILQFTKVTEYPPNERPCQ